MIMTRSMKLSAHPAHDQITHETAGNTSSGSRLSFNLKPRDMLILPGSSVRSPRRFASLRFGLEKWARCSPPQRSELHLGGRSEQVERPTLPRLWGNPRIFRLLRTSYGSMTAALLSRSGLRVCDDPVLWQLRHLLLRSGAEQPGSLPLLLCVAWISGKWCPCGPIQWSSTREGWAGITPAALFWFHSSNIAWEIKVIHQHRATCCFQWKYSILGTLKLHLCATCASCNHDLQKLC